MDASERYILYPPPASQEASRIVDYHHLTWLTEHNALQGAHLRPAALNRVVDLCCSTGTWACAFARKHPACRVVGVDVRVPQFSELNPSPLNAHFVEGDVDGEWDFQLNEAPLDFIYGRMLAVKVTAWTRLFEKCFEHLAVGGTVEINDPVHQLFCRDKAATEADAPALEWWRRVFQRGSVARGIDLGATYKHGDDMRAAGLEVVRNDILRWYLGGQDPGKTEREKVIGESILEAVIDVVPGVTENVIRHGGLEDGFGADEARELAQRAVKDLRETSETRGYYVEMNVVIGRKMRK